jgi:UDP-3-O-[3-hydroxymyristoyl] glucosamine N-acyltransferase
LTRISDFEEAISRHARAPRTVGFFDERKEIRGCNAVTKATETELSFIANYVEKQSALAIASSTRSGFLLAPTSLQAEIKRENTIFLDNPRMWFVYLVNKFKLIPSDAPPLTIIGEAKIEGLGVSKHGYVRIGEDVSLLDYSVIGLDGFGFERIVFENRTERFPHFFGVELEDGVEIGAYSNVDRGVFENTVVKKQTKIDKHVHVAHNVKIGENCEIVAGTIIGGSVVIGDGCFVGENVSLRDNVKIGNKVFVGMGSNVVNDIPDNVTIMGNPARIVK